MDDLVEEFLIETGENLTELDTDILDLEKNPNNKDLISRIFRLVHTVKGTCGFLGLPRLEKVAHHSENIMGRYRDGSLKVDQDSVSVILEAFDRIKKIVEGIAETGTELEGDDSELIKKLDIIYEGEDVSVKNSASESKDVFVEENTSEIEDVFVGDMPSEIEDVFVGEIPSEIEDVFVGEIPSENEDKTEEEVTEDMVEENVTQADVQEEAPVEANEENQEEIIEGDETGKKPAIEAHTLRVSVDVLENLMTTVSELVLSRNQIMQILRTEEDSPFNAPLQRLNHVVSELQEGVMQTRMQPVGNAWNKLPRIIRDLSIELDKKINLEMRGQDTELDRQVLELIKDPLTHMVRNSADHGIEIPADRIAAGKSETGTVLLDAFHEGGHIIIEISDDGAGLNVDAIKKKAIENKITTVEALKDMGDQQVHQFIFAAGFSTAAEVTAVSGRGVGMDVVRTNIEKIGGTVEMRSILGKGSTFTIKIPLTLAIVSALIVEAKGERYAIPQISVRELVRLSTHGDNKLEEIHGAPVLRLRDRLLPLVSLSEVLKLEENDTVLKDLVEEGRSDNKDKVTNLDANKQVIVAQVGANNYGIIVDRVFDTEEIVVKPVSPVLKSIRIFSGNTILGDGSVIMILDPNGMANQMGDVTRAGFGEDLAAEKAETLSDSAQKTSLLVFNAGDGAQRAVPLSLVSRLEDFPVDNIEISGERKVVQYRERLMPLIPFNSGTTMKEEGSQAVLVFSERERFMGLMVDDIVDILEEVVDIQISSDVEKGVLGSAIIDGKAMDIVDVGYFLSQAYGGEWYGSEDSFGAETGDKRILLIDDSPFFRNMLSPMLSVAGYKVVSSESAGEALSLCDAGEKFDIIISDIEMPDMNGFEFAKKIKADDSSWKDTPLVALSSHATQMDLDKGKEVGFDDYVAKFDRDSLLESIKNIGDVL